MALQMGYDSWDVQLHANASASVHLHRARHNQKRCRHHPSEHAVYTAANRKTDKVNVANVAHKIDMVQMAKLLVA